MTRDQALIIAKRLKAAFKIDATADRIADEIGAAMSDDAWIYDESDALKVSWTASDVKKNIAKHNALMRKLLKGKK